MLSADAVLGAAADTALASDLDFPEDAETHILHCQDIRESDSDASNTPYLERITYNPSHRIEHIFSGLSDFEDIHETESDLGRPSASEDTLETERDQRASPVSGDVPSLEAEPGETLPVSIETLDTRLTKPVYDYFNDALDPPSTDGISSVV